jgi:hypothetical protein
MYQREGVKEGMTVRSVDGHRLGRVYAVGESEFHIEKGLFFPKDYSVRYSEVGDIVDGEIILIHGKESLRPFSSDALYNINIDPLDSGRVGGTPATARPMDRDIASRDAEAYAAQPMSRRVEGLRTEDLGEQEIGEHNTEGARASPFLTEEDRAIPRPAPKTLPLEPGIGLPLRHEAEQPTMRASSSPPREEERTVIVAEDELYDEPRRPETREDTDLNPPRRLDFSGEQDPKKRGV